MCESEGEAPQETKGAPRYTVLGVFDDLIDAEQALLALRRQGRPPEQVSVLVRDRAADNEKGETRPGQIARAVVAHALSPVSGWLLGLASLIVAEHGTLLVAGPLGAALAGLRTRVEQGVTDGAEGASTDLHSGALAGSVRHTLTQFGFQPDEAVYIEHRLAAGSVLAAVTTPDADQLPRIRRVFARNGAVYIGQAQTGEVIATEATELLTVPPEQSGTPEVVVADAVVRWHRLCQEEPLAIELRGLCGANVVDRHGEEIGQVEELLAVAEPEAAKGPTIRYLVVRFARVLGLLRHRVAVPADQADLTTDPVRLKVDKEVLRRAPPFEPGMPFSRREEMAVHAYFGSTPYWLT